MNERVGRVQGDRCGEEKFERGVGLRTWRRSGTVTRLHGTYNVIRTQRVSQRTRT